MFISKVICFAKSKKKNNFKEKNTNQNNIEQRNKMKITY